MSSSAVSLKSAGGAGDPASPAGAFELPLQLLGYLSRCYGSSHEREQRSLMSLGGVLSYMAEHLDEPLTVGQLAWQAGMSESTLTRRFRSVLGCPPVEYLIRLRIRQARQFLRDPDMNVTEIALACGFSDSNFFSRTFRRVVGESPRDYRKRVSSAGTA